MGQALEILREFLEITQRIYEGVCSGELKDVAELLSQRQNLIDDLGPLLEKLTDSDRPQALALLQEIAQKDAEIRLLLEKNLKEELSALRQEFEVLRAAKALRKSLESPSFSRFLDHQG